MYPELKHGFVKILSPFAMMSGSFAPGSCKLNQHLMISAHLFLAVTSKTEKEKSTAFASSLQL